MKIVVILVLSAITLGVYFAFIKKPNLPLSFDSPEMAIVSIENAYKMKDRAKILLCKDFNLEAKFISPDEPRQMPPGKVIRQEDLDKVRKMNTQLYKLKYLHDLKDGIPEWNGVKARITDVRKITEDMVVVSEDISGHGQSMQSEMFVGRAGDGKWKVLMEYSKSMEDSWIGYYGKK
jgi:hypothetical protein